MKRTFWHAMLALLVSGCLHAADRAGPSPPGAPAGSPAADQGAARGAIQRALVFLARDGDWWMTGGKGVPGGGRCVSCHQVGFALWSHRESARVGLAIAGDGIGDLERRAFAYFADHSDEAYPFTWGQLLMGREAALLNDEAGKPWREIPEKIAQAQTAEGSWQAKGQFSSQKRPEPESDAVVTMWVLQALATCDDLAPQVVASRQRAWAWIQSRQPGVSTEWLLVRMLVERQLGDYRAAEGFAARLIQSQQADGGWRWLTAQDGNPSDAFATGQSVYALRLSGLGPQHPAIRRGVDYLLRAQQPDGTWIVPSPLVSNKGEPGGKIEYIYKYWSTAWATIGLARTLL